MTTKTRYLIPAFAAVFALMFTFASPLALAESGEEWQGKWTGQKQHKMHKVVEVEGFVGSIQITEDTDKKTLRDQVSVSLSEAADGLDVKGGHIGVAVNENGDKFLVWKLVQVDKDSESETATITIHIVDAADADNTTTITKEFDRSNWDGKFSHDGDKRADKLAKMQERFSESTGDPEPPLHGDPEPPLYGDRPPAREELQNIRSQINGLRGN